jgi:hypothetical protein
MTNPEKMKSRVDSLGVLLTISACLSMTLFLAYRMGPSIVDPDIWHEMALMRTALDLGYIPYQDNFAYTETIFPVVHHEWAAGLIAYSLSYYFGASGIVFLRFLLPVILISLLIYSLKKCKAKLSVILFLLPIPIFLWAYGTSTVRAQMYSFIFTAILLISLDFDNRGKRWWIPIWLVLFTIWLNLHGGFLVGLGLTATYCFEQMCRNRPYKHIIAVILTMIVLIAVNPYGFHYYPYLLNAITMERPHIPEWGSILTISNSEIIFFIILLLISGYAFWRRGFANTNGIFLLLITAIVSIKSNRLLPFYAILWIYYVPSWLETTSLRKNIDNIFCKQKLFLIAFYLVISIFCGLKVLQFSPWNLQIPDSKRPSWGEHQIYPVGAVKYLRFHDFKGNILVPFDWGAYISWKLYPNVKVSLDSRYEVAYPKQVVNDQVALFMGEQNWKELLVKYAPDIILTHRRLPLTNLIKGSIDWEKVYTDHQWDIYAKKTSNLLYENGPSNFSSGKFP